jgi:hypothetical protein
VSGILANWNFVRTRSKLLKLIAERLATLVSGVMVTLVAWTSSSIHFACETLKKKFGLISIRFREAHGIRSSGAPLKSQVIIENIYTHSSKSSHHLLKMEENLPITGLTHAGNGISGPGQGLNEAGHLTPLPRCQGTKGTTSADSTP